MYYVYCTLLPHYNSYKFIYLKKIVAVGILLKNKEISIKNRGERMT